jgi:hypothetical protein
MSIHSAVPATNSPDYHGRRGITHAALAAVGAITMIISSTHALAAQAPDTAAKRWELRFTSGALVPTGNQRNVLKDAQLSAAQVSWLVRPSVAVSGTFGWARSRDLTGVDTPKLDVFTSDIGVEVRGAERFADRAVTFRPFAGLGGGARSYNYRALDIDAAHNLAGYGTVGADVGLGRVGLRLEARNYVTGFKPLAGTGTSDTRNDFVLTAALSFGRQRAPQK